MLGSFMYSTCFFVLFLLFCIILKYNYIPFRNCHFMFFTMWIFFIRVLKYWTSSGGLEVGGVFCLFFYTLANTQTFLGLHIKLQILNYFDGKKKNCEISGFYLQEFEISCSALDFSIHKQNKGLKVGWLGFFSV